jgi:sulfide:quinone oxidoreductase
MKSFSVVICGAGIAGVEALLRLRRLANSRVDVTLVSPGKELVYRPLTVLEPFSDQAARHYSIERIVADTGSTWIPDSLGWIDRDERTVHTAGGAILRYDALLLALGGRELPPAEPFEIFTGRDGGALYRDVVDAIVAGQLTNLAFVQPRGPTWALPLYELALMTAGRAREAARTPELSFVIPGPKPLAPLGGDAGDAIEGLLSDAGIVLYPDADAHIDAEGRLILGPGGIAVRADRTISLPTIHGPNVRGIPGFATDRFLHVDEYCRIRDTDGRIFAAGDATDLPVKHGGIGAQQADVAAAGIAHLAGIGSVPPRLRPRINATVFTGREPLYLSAYLIDGRGWHADTYAEPPWPVADKVVGAELGPYLRSLDSGAAAPD